MKCEPQGRGPVRIVWNTTWVRLHVGGLTMQPAGFYPSPPSPARILCKTCKSPKTLSLRLLRAVGGKPHHSFISLSSHPYSFICITTCLAMAAFLSLTFTNLAFQICSNTNEVSWENNELSINSQITKFQSPTRSV